MAEKGRYPDRSIMWRGSWDLAHTIQLTRYPGLLHDEIRGYMDGQLSAKVVVRKDRSDDAWDRILEGAQMALDRIGGWGRVPVGGAEHLEDEERRRVRESQREQDLRRLQEIAEGWDPDGWDESWDEFGE